MAATTQAAHVPLEVYLSTSYEPDAEYVNGAVEERPMGEYDHSSWQHALELWFAQHGPEWGVKVRPELRVQVSTGNLRVPDVTVLDRNLPIEQVITRPPIAVFEILSPEDTVNRLLAKLDDYGKMGIRTILVIDPKEGRHLRYANGALEPLPAEPFAFPPSACRFDLAEIEKLLD
ncbi:MAG TPA: Uma2 family endonuclease [Terracidiphilus sp.]|nr:Uma2 family endonuclease [Terracidiphilus sp.]